jgi:hypothetical protein
VQSTGAIHDAALSLLSRLPLENRRVRLTGVGVSGLSRYAASPSLFPSLGPERGRALEELAVRIADRFDDEWALTRASLLEKTRRS